MNTYTHMRTHTELLWAASNRHHPLLPSCDS